MRARIGLGLITLLMGTSACSHQPDWPVQQQATFAALNLADVTSICVTDHALSTSSSFFILLGAGLLTGLSHCLGMCGPLVGAFAMRRRAENREISTPLVLFQTGRLTTYFGLGAMVGSVGYVVTPAIHNWQGVFSVILGLLMALLGLALLGFLPLQRWISYLMPTRLVSGWIKHLMASPHPTAPFGLGLANGLLPCGPVYAMVLLAAASGDPLRGASIMLIFGLGTLPAMLGIGFSATLLSLNLRSHLYRIAAILVIIVGVQLMMRGLALSGQIPHAAIGSVMIW